MIEIVKEEELLYTSKIPFSEIIAVHPYSRYRRYVMTVDRRHQLIGSMGQRVQLDAAKGKNGIHKCCKEKRFAADARQMNLISRLLPKA